MSAEYFLDTNIFVYTFDVQQPDKQKRARELVGKALKDGTGCISYQVVQEFLNVAVRKFNVPLSPADANDYLTKVLVFSNCKFSAIHQTHQWHLSCRPLRSKKADRRMDGINIPAADCCSRYAQCPSGRAGTITALLYYFHLPARHGDFTPPISSAE